MNLGRLAWASGLILSAVPGVLWGQNAVLTQFNPVRRGGSIQLQGISVFSAYYSGGPPFGSSVLFGAPGSDAYAGISASIGWGKSGPKSSASLSYSPSYFRAVPNSDFSSVNHNLSMNWSTKVARRWTFGASAAGIVSNLQQLLFTPTQLSNVASLPASFDELAAAVLAGRFSSLQMASILTGAPVLSSPERTSLYGDRLFSATLQTTLSYAPSQRSSINFGVYATRAQQLQRPGASAEASAGYLIPHTTAGGVNLGWSYSLTPRTQIGADVATSRIFSRNQQAYITRATASIGRTMSRRWFVQGRFGAGFLTYIRQTSAGPRGGDYIAGGGIGYKTRAHTFLGSYDRMIGDAYGIGAGSTMAATGGWTWRRPGKPWSVFSSIGHQRLAGSVFGDIEGWTGTVGLARSLGAHMGLSAQYGYFQFPSHGILSRSDLSRKGVLVSLTWTPVAHR